MHFCSLRDKKTLLGDLVQASTGQMTKIPKPELYIFLIKGTFAGMIQGFPYKNHHFPFERVAGWSL